MNISDLICEVINQYHNAFNQGLAKTKLLKLVYLTEVMYKRRYGERITDAEWVYYLYGPYLWNYDEILQNTSVIDTRNVETDAEQESQIISLKQGYNDQHIQSDIKFLISNTVRTFGEMDLRSLLDYVYFETEPMINVEERSTKLDFNCIMPEEYYKVKELKIDSKTEKRLRQDFKKKVEALRGKRN